MPTFERVQHQRCTICGRRRTLLVRIQATNGWHVAYRWACWRPSHYRAAGQAAERAVTRMRDMTGGPK